MIVDSLVLLSDEVQSSSHSLVFISQCNWWHQEWQFASSSPNWQKYQTSHVGTMQATGWGVLNVQRCLLLTCKDMQHQPTTTQHGTSPWYTLYWSNQESVQLQSVHHWQLLLLSPEWSKLWKLLFIILRNTFHNITQHTITFHKHSEFTIIHTAKQLISAASYYKLKCGPMPDVMVALPSIGGTLCSTPQSLADAHY